MELSSNDIQNILNIKIGEKMEPNIEFIPFSNDIIANLTVQEIFNMYNLNFSGLSRLRKDIQKKDS